MFFSSRQQGEKLCDDILSMAKKYGASSADIAIEMESGFSVTVRLGNVETVEYNRDKQLSLTVYRDHRTGSASTTDFSEASVEKVVKKACDIANYSNEDPCAGLADAKLMAYDYPDLDLFYPWNLSPEKAIELAAECEQLALKQDNRLVNSEGASLQTSENLYFYANTHGFKGVYPFSEHGLSCTLIAKQNDQMQRDYEYIVSRDPKELDSVSELARKTALKTINRLGARQISTRQAPVIFDAHVARALLSNFMSAISGGSLYRRASFLLDHLEKPVFSSHLSLYQRPHLPKTMGAAPFDDEGVRTQDRDFVRDGILKSYLLGTYSARKLNLVTTGNAGGVQNLFITTSEHDLNGLLKKMGSGLLVTELIGQGVNIVTGDYSRGVFGYWVENGEIQFPVEEITIAGNLKDMFLNVIAVGNDVDHRGSIHTGSILLEEMTIGGE